MAIESETMPMLLIDDEAYREALDALWKVCGYSNDDPIYAMFARFAENRAPSAEAKDAWQPIETAPKDGITILVWCKYADAPMVGSFKDYGRGERFYPSTEGYEVGCGAYCYGGSVQGERENEPTHWMPLPEAPK